MVIKMNPILENGIRILDNWFTNAITELNLPIISTSVNITSKKHMASLNDLNKTIAKQVDFIIYEGKKTSRPSKIVNLTTTKTSVKKRV